MNVYNGGGTPKLQLKNGPAEVDDIRNRIITVRATIKNGEYRLQDRISGEVNAAGPPVRPLNNIELGGDHYNKRILQGYIRPGRIYRHASPARSGEHRAETNAII